MLGFHRRARSLISVKTLERFEKTAPVAGEDGAEQPEDVYEPAREPAPGRQRQLMLIYVVFVAESIMISSLQPQLRMLIDSDNLCAGLGASYLRSILESAYAFGGAAALIWGYMADRVGRRPVTLLGLAGMFTCCLCMGFATNLATCAIFRVAAGATSSSVVMAAMTMLGDISQDPTDRIRNIAALPFVAACGSVAPLVQRLVTEAFMGYGIVWEKYPVVSNQVACCSMVLLIGVVEAFMLEETLPTGAPAEDDIDCEKAGFLGQTLADETANIPSIHVMDVDFHRSEPISIGQFIQAPTLLVLLSSFSLLSLHAATFDTLLPHLGHSGLEHGGMGVPCEYLPFTVLGLRLIVGLMLVRWFAPVVTKCGGLLQLYRQCSAALPILYATLPLLVLLLPFLGSFISIYAVFFKYLFAGSSQTVVALLVLNAAPDAFSAGTVVGLMQVSSLFKALAVAVSGASYYLSDDWSVATTNYILWASLAAFGVLGAVLAWFVKERPSVEHDYPSRVLTWETCYDADEIDF